MSMSIHIRKNVLRVMYGYTLVGAGGLGIALLLAPEKIASQFGWSETEPIVLGLMASVLLAFAGVLTLGLRDPLKFVPVLLLQLCYKVVWLVAVVLPQTLAGNLPSGTHMLVIIYITFVVGDLIAIPFSGILEKSTG